MGSRGREWKSDASGQVRNVQGARGGECHAERREAKVRSAKSGRCAHNSHLFSYHHRDTSISQKDLTTAAKTLSFQTFINIAA